MVPAPAYTQLQSLPSSSSSHHSNNNDTILHLKAQAQSHITSSASSSTSSSSRLTSPLRLTNAFARRGIEHYNLTPAIGTEFEKGQIDLASLLSRDDDDIEAQELLQELAVMSELCLLACFFVSSFFSFLFPLLLPSPLLVLDPSRAWKRLSASFESCRRFVRESRNGKW